MFFYTGVGSCFCSRFVYLPILSPDVMTERVQTQFEKMDPFLNTLTESNSDSSSNDLDHDRCDLYDDDVDVSSSFAYLSPSAPLPLGLHLLAVRVLFEFVTSDFSAMPFYSVLLELTRDAQIHL